MIEPAVIHTLADRTGQKVVDSYGQLLESVASHESVTTPNGSTYNVKTHNVGGVIHVVDISLMADQLNG